MQFNTEIRKTVKTITARWLYVIPAIAKRQIIFLKSQKLKKETK